MGHFEIVLLHPHENPSMVLGYQGWDKILITVFPRIVSAETIQGRKVLICYFFVIIHDLNNDRTFFDFDLSTTCSFQSVIK